MYIERKNTFSTLLMSSTVLLFFYKVYSPTTDYSTLKKLLLFTFHAHVLFIRFCVSDYSVITPLGRACASAKVKETHDLVRAGHG